MIRILIVEDDENISKMLAATLSIGDYEYDRCADGEEAVQTILNGTYDLILLDVMLPGMDGFAVLEHIRGESCETPVIFLTALGAVADKVKGLRGGAEDYIVKPFEPVELLARIEVVLTPKEFDVLVFFMRNPDVAITREQLLSNIWGFDFTGESRSVDIHVQQVRRKMGLQGKLITIPKLGYRLERR